MQSNGLPNTTNSLLKRTLAVLALLGAFANASAGLIMRDVMLWCLDDRAINRADFGKFSSYYREVNGTQQFQFYRGDVSTEGRIHARLEMFGVEKFYPGTEWWVFEGTFRVKTDEASVSIAQFKDNVYEHPSIMVHMEGKNQLSFSPRGQGATTLGADLYDKPFTLKMRSNGKDEELWFNGKRMYAGISSNYTAYGQGAKNYFRWGFYNNEAMRNDAYMTVSNVFMGKEKDYKTAAIQNVPMSASHLVETLGNRALRIDPGVYPAEIRLISADGQLVRRQILQAPTAIGGRLNAGVYMVQIRTAGSIQSEAVAVSD
jgi:hypothetical protein